MRVVHRKGNQYPGRPQWNPRPLRLHPGLPASAHAAELKINRGRLVLWLVVVDKQRMLPKAWKAMGMGHVGRDTLGAVNAFSTIVYSAKTGKTRLEVDPRVFAFMMLNRENLGMEVITHECGHAAMAYTARVHAAKTPWADTEAGRGDGEEHLCHALGRIARAVVLQLDKWGLLP